MQPHVQVKMLEFNAALAAFKACRGPGPTMMSNLNALMRTGNELSSLSQHITDNDVLREIFEAIQRADAALDAELARRKLNGPR